MFNKIGHKILAVVGGAVTLGLVSMAYFYTTSQEASILSQNERSAGELTSSVYQTLKAIMLTGNGDLARAVADRLKDVHGVEDFRILRINGLEAFRDNDTIDSVNERRGEEEFAPRDDVETVRVLPAENTHLRQALQTGENVAFYERKAGGERLLTVLAPMENLKGCHRCHGGRAPIRGVIKITTSLAAAQADIETTRLRSIIVLVLALLATIGMTSIMIRRNVVSPIERVTQAMARASHGDLTQQVPVIGRDEVTEMAESFNSMIRQLLSTYTGLQHEQNKLTTIILSAREGIIVTDHDNHIVLVNPAAERLLGKSTEQIVAEGFLEILDNAQAMHKRLEQDVDPKSTETGDIVEYKDRSLMVNAASIRSSEGNPIGSAALLRDITEEKQLEESLRKLSATDGLTGLFNRRYMDEALATELTRAIRYPQPLSIIMFDVDHFKRFNDEHGHEQGDRVLKMLAAEVCHDLRSVDITCRYGGEEFFIILPNTNSAAAAFVAERVRARIDAVVIDGLRVTISMGVATFPDSGFDTPDALVSAADAALYEAKAAGRNCVKVAPAKAESL